MDDGDVDDDGLLGRRRVEIRDAAGGGVQVLPAYTNLSWKPNSKRPIVYDSYGIPQGITTGTFRLVSTCLNFKLHFQTKVLTSYFTLITFPTHHFLNLTRPLENTTHIAERWPNPKQYVFVFLYCCIVVPADAKR